MSCFVFNLIYYFLNKMSCFKVQESLFSLRGNSLCSRTLKTDMPQDMTSRKQSVKIINNNNNK